jgi:hypothetical protein
MVKILNGQYNIADRLKNQAQNFLFFSNGIRYLDVHFSFYLCEGSEKQTTMTIRNPYDPVFEWPFFEHNLCLVFKWSPSYLLFGFQMVH